MKIRVRSAKADDGDDKTPAEQPIIKEVQSLDKPVDFTVKITKEGEYRIAADIVDKDGHPNQTAVAISVAGGAVQTEAASEAPACSFAAASLSMSFRTRR